MKPRISLILISSLCVTGCGSDGGTPAEEQKLRATLGQKEVDFASVPSGQRAMVLGQMRSHGASAKADELEKQWGTQK